MSAGGKSCCSSCADNAPCASTAARAPQQREPEQRRETVTGGMSNQTMLAMMRAVRPRASGRALRSDPFARAPRMPQAHTGMARTGDGDAAPGPVTAPEQPAGDVATPQPGNDAPTPAQAGEVSDGAHACVIDEQIPRTRSGIINGSGQVGERFDVAITWRNDIPPPPGVGASYCACRCGEYRQYTKGYFTVNGGPHETQHLWAGALFEESVWHEDGRDLDPTARYGHRDEPQKMDEDYKPTRADGCTYVGRDFPRVMIGSDTDMLFQFKGQTFDKCNNVFGPIHEWEVRYNGPINRGP